MIEGKLVNLRAQEMADLDRMLRWVNDREVTRHLNVRYPYSRLAEEAFITDRASQVMTYANVHFAIETKDGAHIGGLGFHVVQPENRKATLGIMIGDKECWSKGYGADALLTLLRFGFDQMNLHRIELNVDADNERAIACYRKCGFVEEGRTRKARYLRGAYMDQLVMSLLRREFYALSAWPAPQGERA